MKIVTHDSSFHTDDVFAVAVLLILHPDAEIIRSRNPEVQATADYLVDTGMDYDPSRRMFDHHQPKGAGVRENGIPYASFGLVWKEFGEKIAGGEREAELIEKRLVIPIDAMDNGVSLAESKFSDLRSYDIGDFINSFVDKRDPESLDSVFVHVVSSAKELLLREIALAKKFTVDFDKVLEYYEKSPDKRLVIMEENLISWKDVLKQKSEVLYVVHPRPDGHWTLSTVQTVDYVSRKSFPKEWGGLQGEDLQKITGVSGAIFCHKALFMAAAQTKQDAIKLAEIALNS